MNKAVVGMQCEYFSGRTIERPDQLVSTMISSDQLHLRPKSTILYQRCTKLSIGGLVHEDDSVVSKNM